MIEPGDKYGEWTVLAPSKDKVKGYWQCQCSCGKIKDVWGSNLKKGNSRSCGHVGLNKMMEKADKRYIGKKFGRLTPIKRVNKKGKAVYLCQCDCGNKAKVKGMLLRNGTTKSCGCIRKENSKEFMKKIKDKGIKELRKGYVDGTSLATHHQKLSKNNKTGVKGVSKTSNGKYRAYINLKRKQIYLGTFETIEEAESARLKAEEKYFGQYKK